jgi:CelD/BcsL family acetyltransferase involved in cellulose biosynthesis
MSSSQRVLPFLTAIEELGPAWGELIVQGGFNPTHHPRWLNAVLQSHDKAASAHVATTWNGSQLIGVFPFFAERASYHGVPLRTVAACTNLVSYHAELTALERHDELLDTALRHAHGGRWDRLEFSNVREPSRTTSLLRSLATPGRTLIEENGERSPYVEITTSWDEFLKTRTKKFRANVIRAVRRMQEEGESAMEWYVGPSNTEALLSHILAIEQRSWKAGAGIGIHQSAVETHYHRELLASLAAMNALFANVLMIQGTPSAYVLGCRFEGWVGQLKTSFDAKLADAGARVIDASAKRAIDEGARIYDFLGDATPHKLKWTDRVLEHRNFWVYSTRLPARAASTIRSLARRFARREAPPAQTPAAAAED